jgi:peptide/nickel transport system substrate-binding protein
MVGQLIYSFLVTDGPNGDNVPDVATSVPTRANGGISRDGLRIVYHLRRNVKWQDGAPLTARDCVFTYGAIMNPNNAIPSHFGYEDITTVRALGPYTLEVTLRRPSRDVVDNFLALDGNYPIMPEHLLARYPSINQIDYNELPVGSGPYRVVNWVHGDHLSLVANRNYFRGAPHIRNIVVEFIPDSSTMLDELRTGEIDAAFSIDPELLAEARSIPTMQVVLTPVTGMGLLVMNAAQGPTSNLRVREAIASAVDDKLIVGKVLRGAFLARNARRVYLKLPAGSEQTPPYDPQRARTLLDEAGWHEGPGGVRVRDGRHLVLPFVTSPVEPMSSAITAVLQAELRAVGIATTIHTYASALYMVPGAAGGPVFGGRFSIAYLQIFGEDDADLQFMYQCSEVPPKGFDISRICDPQLDRYLEAGSVAATPHEIELDNALVERELDKDVPDAVLYQQRTISVFTKRLHGFDPSPVTPYSDVWRWSLRSRY